jgi:hypothetical protein
MLERIIAGIEWIGGQGTRAVAAVLLLGIALPPLSAVARPILPLAVFGLLVLAFVRVDGAAVAIRLRRPAAALLAIFWVMLAVPLGFGLVIHLGGTGFLHPDLVAALVVVTVAAPIMSAPAFSYLLGLDGALSLAVLVGCMIVTPLTAPILVEFLVGEHFALSASELAFRLGFLLAGSFGVAYGLRRWFGEARIAARGRLIDGLNVLTLFTFTVAIMDGVVATALVDPLLVAGVIVLAFGFSFFLLIVSTLVFLRLGMETALTVGIACANRNMGLMAAAMTGAVPDIAWLYFALGQFPIFLMPQITKPAIVALLTRHRASSRPVSDSD